MSDINDLEYDAATEIAEEEIARFVEQAYRTALACVGDIGDEAAQRKGVEQMRHLYLAEPWLPAVAIVKRLRDMVTAQAAKIVELRAALIANGGTR